MSPQSTPRPSVARVRRRRAVPAAVRSVGWRVRISAREAAGGARARRRGGRARRRRRAGRSSRRRAARSRRAARRSSPARPTSRDRRQLEVARAAARARAAAAAPRDQRDRRRAAHQPRPRAARRPRRARRSTRSRAATRTSSTTSTSGERGSRHDHLRALLRELTGAEDAIVVNNNAAATVLGLAALAAGQRGRRLARRAGRDRRLVPHPRHPARCRGGALVEVGTTNKTHARDYESAIGPATGLLLKVHRSNFAIVGFTARGRRRTSSSRSAARAASRR